MTMPGGGVRNCGEGFQCPNIRILPLPLVPSSHRGIKMSLQGYTQRSRGGWQPGRQYRAPQTMQNIRQANYGGQPHVPAAYADMINAGPGPFRRILQNFPWVERSVLTDFMRSLRDAYEPKYWISNWALAGGAANTNTIQTGANLWFVVDSITGTQTGIYTIQIKELETGRFLNSAPTTNGCMVGTAANPGYLPTPWIVSGSLTIDVTDLTAVANTIYVALNGILIYPGRASRMG